MARVGLLFNARPGAQAAILIGFLSLFRLVYIGFAPVTAQEAYYWLYSTHPALGYVDHPPMVAYAIFLGTWLFGDNGFGIKFVAVIASLGVNVLLYLTSVRALRSQSQEAAENTGLLAVVLYNSTLFAHTFAVIQQPDSTLLFFWLLVIFFVQEFLLTERPRNLIFAGIATGLGMLCKYTAIAILPGIALTLLLSSRGRKALLTPYPWLAVAAALLIFSPVVYWNWSHDWGSFRFQFGNRGTRISTQDSIQIKYFFQLLGTQLAMLMPLVFVLLVRFYLKMMTRWRESSRAYLYFLSGFFLIAGFVLLSFATKVKVHWLLPGYLGVVLGIAALFGQSISLRSRWHSTALWFSALLIVVSHVLFVIPGFQIFQANSWSGWRELTAQVVDLQQKLGGKDQVFLFANSHKTAAYLSFYSNDHQTTYATNIYGLFAKQFNVWGVDAELDGKNALFVTSSPEIPAPHAELMMRYFDDLSKVAKYSYPFNGFKDRPSRDIYCFLATNYRLQPR